MSVTVLAEADSELLRACHAQTARERYVVALNAAGLAASAMLNHHRVRHVAPGAATIWGVLGDRVPELLEWADFFAFSAARRSHLSGPQATISARSADDLVRAAQNFLDLVGELLGCARPQQTLRLVPVAG